jgi:hypothetical protein
LASFNLKKLTVLRQLTLRVIFLEEFTFSSIPLLILSIPSPVFSVLVLELGRFHYPSRGHRERWSEIDRFLEQRYAKHGDFKLVIRCDWDIYPTAVKETFPLLGSRGCIHFEIPHSTGK